MLLLAIISLHMLTFRLMVTMVSDFRSLVILIHNTLQGEITISSTWTTRVNYTPLPQYIMIHFHMQRLKFIDFMVIELRFKKKNKVDKMQRSNFQILCTYYITTQQIFVYRLSFTNSSPWYHKSTSNWKWKWTKSLYIVFNGDRS